VGELSKLAGLGAAGSVCAGLPAVRFAWDGGIFAPLNLSIGTSKKGNWEPASCAAIAAG
jgi:hypothetical protein